MHALVVGGTSGFGLATSERLADQGYRVDVVGRSDLSSVWQYGRSYSCDVGDLASWKQSVTQIRKADVPFDLVVCAIGYGRLKPYHLLTEQDYRITAERNLTYVKVAYRMLRRSLEQSAGMFVTLGSRWSYREPDEWLYSYALMKHRLMEWTLRTEQQSKEISLRHICVPVMQTPQFEAIRRQAAVEGYEQEWQRLMSAVPANPECIAEAFVASLNQDMPVACQITSEGLLRPVL